MAKPENVAKPHISCEDVEMEKKVHPFQPSQEKPQHTVEELENSDINLTTYFCNFYLFLQTYYYAIAKTHSQVGFLMILYYFIYFLF